MFISMAMNYNQILENSQVVRKKPNQRFNLSQLCNVRAVSQKKILKTNNNAYNYFLPICYLYIAFEDFPISIIESEPTGINPCIEEVGGIHNFQVKVPIGIKSGAKEAHVRKYQFHKFFFNHRHAFFFIYIHYFRSDYAL